jgi:hypothetical protein
MTARGALAAWRRNRARRRRSDLGPRPLAFQLVKRKRYAELRLSDGTIVRAELHWYEATGIGKREFKIKRFL